MEKTDIKFGTDGFRGILGKDFTFETLRRILGAINLYLKDKKTIIVGYDPRLDARQYAEFCANYLKDCGFKVILSKKVVPTPVVAYCAKHYPESIGAIMLTASHNPPEYQGIKFIPNYAGPATKEITDNILKFLDKNDEFISGGQIIECDLEEEYFSHIEKLIDFDAIKKNQPKIIFDGLYSSTIGYFDKLLDKNNIKYESFNMYHDSNFGGGLPEPKEKFMKHTKEGYITFANDGDGDRYGVIDEKGNYVSPNIVLSMLLKYLILKQKKGFMIKTVGVSRVVDIVAEKLNVKTITTPVGFKWLSEAMRNNPCIIAGEDSGGLSTGEHIPEKDGIFANLLILEMVAKENKPLYKLVEEINEFANCKFYTDRVDVKTDKDVFFEDVVAGYKIADTLKIDGVKYFLDDKNTSLLIRKSGTEPLLRFYIESDKIEKLEKIKKYISESNFN